MGVFPQLGNISESVQKVLNDRAGNNLAVSKLMSWIRVSSAGTFGNKFRSKLVLTESGNFNVVPTKLIPKSKGLILESLPTGSSFTNLYGKSGQSGRIGVNFDGGSVFAAGTDRSNRPSPTINSLSVENGAQGLSKKATFEIKCFTLKQADEIAKHFLEPGFVVLVEFGWNQNESIQQKADLKKGACAIASYNNYNHILDKRNKSNGTYDAFMGYITGGGFKNSDGDTYIISVELTTLGEIPAYLQPHKNGVFLGKSTPTGGNLFATSELEQDAKDTKTYGKFLFKQMFNLLPKTKQTDLVKGLIDKPMKSQLELKKGTPLTYSDQGNFINFDEDLREDITNLSGDKIVVSKDEAGKKTSVRIPDGVKLISEEHSFIRLELAFEIINSYHVNLSSGQSAGCSKMTTFNYRINAFDTVIRAHKHMFPLDNTKLYIPNENLPDFGILATLTSTEVKKPEPIVESTGKVLNTIQGCIMEDKSNYEFPRNSDSYTSNHLPDVIPTSADKGTYGYLRDLYINFKFFIELLDQPNFLAKDLYYELLNGISTAVNSYWEFDIFVIPDTSPLRYNAVADNHPYELAVRDLTFSGDVSIDKEIPSFITKGIKSPFLTSNLDMDIPAIMRNSLLGKRSSNQIELQMDGIQTRTGNFFATGEDRVLRILNSFKEVSSPTIEEQTPPKKLNTIDSRKQNLDLFLQNATIIPKTQDRTKNDIRQFFGNLGGSTNTTFEELFVVASWNDSTLLSIIKNYDEVTHSKSGSIANPAILSIGFSFEVHGVSGIKVGDIFKIIDLPAKFKSGVFQVTTVQHQLSDNLWKTTIEAKMRNL